MKKSKIYQVLEQMKEFRTEVNERFDKIEREHKEFKIETNKRFDGIDKRLDKMDEEHKEFKAETNKRFDAIDERFIGIDKRFDKMDEDHKEFIQAVQVDLLRAISENTLHILNHQDAIEKLQGKETKKFNVIEN